jgi:uncharacterized protein with GYD domain
LGIADRALISPREVAARTRIVSSLSASAFEMIAMALASPVVERLGGKLIGGWAAFGDYDTILIAELPTSVDTAAIAIAAAAGGSCKAVKTTALLTAEEAVEAMKKVSNTGYRPVAASAAAAKK